MTGRKDLPPPDTRSVLSNRFSIDEPPVPIRPAETRQPHTPRTAHTSAVRATGGSSQTPASGRREPMGMVRRTYYYSASVADSLAAAVDQLHYGSNGRIPKNEALDAIIAAGVEQLDQISRRLGA